MNQKQINQLLFNVFLGAILVAIVSYITFLYDTNPEYLKITSFLWGVPIIYFYLLFITYQQSNDAMKAFTIHATIGSALTLLIMFVTIYMIKQKYNIKKILLVNIIYGILVTLLYFVFKIYEKI
jgi:hypothetical protein